MNAQVPENCGDWLLLRDGAATPPPGRSGAWRQIFRGGGRALWSAPPRSGWVGAPWRTGIVAKGSEQEAHFWLLGESPASDKTLEIALFGLEKDEDPSRQLGGRFLLLIYRCRQESFEVVTDRFATLHAYRAADGDAVGTSYRSVSSASSQRLDWTGLSSFFALGFFLGERTHYDDVRCLGPARRHVLGRQGTASSSRYWHWRHQPENRRQPVETARELADLLSVVVSENAEGRVALPISGGLDSRALAAALPQGADVWSFAYGYQPGSIETRLAREIAKRRGLSFADFVVDAYLEDKAELALATVEGFQDITQSRQIYLSDVLAERADVVLGGHWGDVWLDDAHVSIDAENNLPATIMGKMAKKGRHWLLEHLCHRHLQSDAEMALEGEIRSELDAYSRLDDIDFRVKAFKTDHWSCRWTLASVRAYQAAAFPRLPFYDPRLADFFATVPTSQVADRRLEADYLLNHAPDLAAVPWQETGVGLRWSRRQAWWLGLPKRAIFRGLRTVRRKPVIERNWEVQWLGAQGRRRLEDLVLKPGLRVHDLVSPLSIRRLVDEFYLRPTASNGYTVSMLATFGLWLETS